MSDIEIKVGDWVRGYRNGLLEIVEVRYVRLGRAGQQLVYTDYGQIATGNILEIRRLAEYIKGDENQ